MSWRFPSLATAVALVVSAGAPALGSPRTDPTVGRAVFTGAATPNATSIDLNPASLGLGVRSEFYISLVGVLDRYSIDRRAVDVDTGALSDGPGSTTDYTTSPGGTLAYILRTGADSRVTLAFQTFHTAPGERFLEREDLRYHTMGGYHRTIAPLTVAASLRITNRLYFGVSIAGQSTYLKLRYARDTALEAARDPARGITSDCGGAPCGIENPLAAERYEIQADSGLLSTGVIAVNLGAVIRVAKDTWLGIGYHAPPGLAIQNELNGSMNVTRSPRDGGETVTGAATVYISQPASLDVEVRSRLAQNLDLHIGSRAEHLSRFKSYDVRGYGSTLPPNGIPEWQPRPRGFHSTFAAWGGVEQVERESQLVLGARFGIETSALEDRKTSPVTIAPHSATIDLGLQYRLSSQLVVQATYGLQYFPTVDVEDSAFDPRAHLLCADSNYDYSTPACTRVREGYAISTAAGEYQRVEQAIRLAVRIERF